MWMARAAALSFLSFFALGGMAAAQQAPMQLVPAQQTPAQQTPAQPGPVQLVPAQQAPGGYDYYVFDLSWTPAYCRFEGKPTDLECAPQVNAGFVLHGLWPQRESGAPPENCPTTERVPESVIEAMLEVMPGRAAIEREWLKHGSCTGMTPDDYFAETRATWERVHVPSEYAVPAPGMAVPAADVERMFVEANDLFELTRDGVAIICDHKTVTEVRVCVDKDLNFRACGKGVEDTCRSGETLGGR